MITDQLYHRQKYRPKSALASGHASLLLPNVLTPVRLTVSRIAQYVTSGFSLNLGNKQITEQRKVAITLEVISATHAEQFYC